MFKAVMLRKAEDGSTVAGIEMVNAVDLPEGDVEVQVAYSTLNYKDGLAITGRGPVVRKWPMIPGIDLAGTVTKSTSADFPEGSDVIVNGHGMGEVHWGGLAQVARLPAAWLTSKPESLSLKDTASIGTAGYTAMLSVLALERHGIKVDDGPILVTGANGGVGSFAVAILARRGFEVHASTGRLAESQRLQSLGATKVIDRAELSERGKPLQKEQWAGAVDCVGSHTLANICAQTRYGGVVTACGLAQGMDFPTSVAPFILRGITLAGIDSVYASQALRNEAWSCLARETDRALLDEIADTVGLDDCIDLAHSLMSGQVKGRIVVDMAI